MDISAHSPFTGLTAIDSFTSLRVYSLLLSIYMHFIFSRLQMATDFNLFVML